MSLEVVFAPRAEQDAIACDRWWSTHHPSKAQLFTDELRRALELISTFPEAAPRARTKRYRGARVKVMAETGHLLVYRQASKTTLRVLGIFASAATAEKP